MIVIYLHQYFNTPSMPGGTRSFEQARQLVMNGHTVYMITSWRTPTTQSKVRHTIEQGIRVLWIPIPYSNHMGFYARLSAFARFAFLSTIYACRIPADVVFATSTPLTICIPAIATKLLRGIPMVFEVRDLWPEVPIALGALRNPLLVAAAKWLERYAYRHSRRVIALAPGMRDGISAVGYPRRRIAVIPNGADIGLFQKKSDENVAEHRPWLNNAQLIVYAGTIGQANGVSYIPKLAAALFHVQPDHHIRFAILGEGRLLDDVRNLAASLGVLDKSVFFIGNIAKSSVPNWLHLSTATIMTYDGPRILYRDSVSNKFFDSLAAGVPVVANFEGFSTLIATTNDAGLILPRDDMRDAAKRLLDWIHDGNAMRERSHKAFSLATSLFNRADLTRNFAQVLSEAALAPRSFQTGNIGIRFNGAWKNASRVYLSPVGRWPSPT